MKAKQCLMGEREQVQQEALELALMYLPEAVPCLWQEPGQVQGGLLRQRWWGLSQIRRCCTDQPGSRAAEGVADRGGVTAGGGHPSRSGTASWSAPASGSSGCTTDVEAGAGSASWAGAGVVRGEKITHVSTFPCAPKVRTQPEPRTHPRMSSPWAAQHMGGEACLCSWPDFQVLPLCLVPTPPHNTTCIFTPISPPCLPSSHPWALPPWAPGPPAWFV